MNYSELETIKLQELNLIVLEQKLKNGELKFEELEDLIKVGYVSINNSQTTNVEAVAIHEDMKQAINLYPEEIDLEKMNVLDVVKPEDYERVVPRFIKHFARQDKHSICTDFQGLLEMQKDGKYNTLISSTKIYGDKLLTLHSPLKNLGVIAPKIEKALELDHFMRKNYEKFASLTKSEKEILQLLASGYSNKEIATMKFISVTTVQTHRRNLKKKLDVKHFRDLLRFAQAFDLV